MKMVLTYRLFFICFVIAVAATTVYGQQPKKVWVQAANPAKPFKGVFIKWTPSPFKKPILVNVYRQEAGATDWVKLTASPWTRALHSIPEAILNADTSMQMAKGAGDAIQTGKTDDSFALLMSLTSAVTNHHLGMYFGIEYLDATAQPGKKYRYEIKEVQGGSEVSWGISEEVDPGKFIQQPPITDITFKAKDKVAKFSWNHEANRILGINVYRAEKGFPLKKINKSVIIPPAPSGGKKAEWLWEDTEVENGKSYTYEFRGVDFFGEETLPSQKVEISPEDATPPAAPEVFGAESKGDQVTMSWTYPGSDDCVGFHIYRSRPDDDSNFVKVTSTPLDIKVLKYVDKAPVLNRSYIYYVSSVDAAGNENPANRSLVFVYDTIPPVMPSGLAAKSDTGIVKLTWVANKDKDIRGYRIYRGLQGCTDVQMLQLSDSWGSTSFNDTLPKNARNKFVYKISAIDSAFNESNRTSPVEARLPDPEPPAAPFLTDAKVDGRAVIIEWLPNLEPDLNGYLVFRAEGSDADTAKWEKLTPQPLIKTSVTYTDKTARPDVKSFYRIRAMDQSENISSFSNSYSAEVKDLRMTITAAMLKGEYDAKKRNVNLSWEVEKSPEVLGCIVYRKDEKTEFLPISGLLQETSYAAPAPGQGIKYVFEIRAFDPSGNFSRSAPITVEIPIESK